jgi:molybdate transport system ATP-binding protein
VTAPGRPGLRLDGQVRRGDLRLELAVDVAPGEVLAVLGPNGAGKSTLLRTLAGLTPLARGQLWLDGDLLDDAESGAFVPPAERPVGLVFQNYRLFPHLTVLDNIAFAPRERGLARREARAAAQDWVRRLDLVDLAAKKPGELSGGQAQRVALARALAGEPRLLLLDEPLSALDARTRLDVRDELRRHLEAFEGPVVLVTHDPLEALVLADRLLVVEDGRVVQQGSPAEVSRRPATDYVARLVGLNLYAGRVDGATVAVTAGGQFTVADHDEHGAVLVAVRPSAVLVSTEPLGGTSARNAWPGTVAGLTLLADRVRLDIDGEPPVVADVTPAAVAELGLHAGSQVWVAVKATDLDVYAASTAQPAPATR